MAFNKTTEKPKKEKEITYSVLEDYGTLSEKNGWALKLRYISWNGEPPKYDLRSWKDDPDGEKCSKGRTFTGEEMENLYGILKKIAEN